MNRYLEISSEVTSALDAGIPIVALESTIISHGMPWPRNLETALMLEDIIRSEGAVPATIAIINGRLKAGLTKEEITALADGSLAPQKASRRDIPALVARNGNGSTTVSGTMIIAQLAGIRVFATGGIGGVHRGAEQTWDISADLEELARTDVAVVCAGAKAILDLPKTMEYLETKGVPVIGFQTSELPAFYSRESGISLSLRCDNVMEVARILDAKWKLGLSGGAIIANPVPVDHAIERKEIDAAITHALLEAEGNGIKGAELTPYLLARIADLTGGESLETNVALVVNNARLAAHIAAAYQMLQRE